MKIGIIGLGLMGRGIALTAYIAALTRGEEPDILVIDAKVDNDELREYFYAYLKKQVDKGSVEIPNFSKSYSPQLSYMNNLADFSGCDLVIEAVKEDVEVKRNLFGELSLILNERAVLASNTSSIPITQLATFYSRASQVIGIHFMNPVPKMPLVEIIEGYQTSSESVALAIEFVHSLGKDPVKCKDSPGFLVNRMLVPMVNEAIFLLQENAATKEEIDKSMKLGANHPMGPLQLADFVGLDTLLSILDILYHEFRDSKYRACPLLVKMVRAGTLGIKSGQGFYEY